MPARRLRILTWHVHGNYLYYLSQVPHDFHLVTDEQRSTHHAGRGEDGGFAWGSNVHEVRVERVREQRFDVVLYQSRAAFEDERHRLLSPAQQRLPAIYLEHDPPQEHPTNTRHWAADAPGLVLVHVTPFNALMWDSGASPVRIVEHGVKLLGPPAQYSGELPMGLAVVNNIGKRGRRLGLDVYLQMREEVPLSLVGMGSQSLAHAGGLGEIGHDDLPGFMARHRFFFNPIRYTSLGLSIIEAMMVGLPIAGLATTELASVIRNGESGCVDTRLPVLAQAMQRWIADPAEARHLGEGARRVAQERFGIERFVEDWKRVFAEVAA